MPGVGTTHHIRLGGHYYMLRPGSYSRRAAPQFGARFQSGDPDFNNMSMWQHWAQRTWIGGMDAEEFVDDAMYDDGVGVNTWEKNKVTLARDLQKGPGANWAIGGTVAQRKFFVYNNKLYCVTIPAVLTTNSVLYVWDYVTDGWTAKAALPTICVRSVALFHGMVFLGGIDSTTGTATQLSWSSGTLAVWNAITTPTGATVGVYGMHAFQRKLYVAYGTQVWRLKENRTWDGNTVFYRADQNSESNYIRSMDTHLGFLYMLSLNGHVHRTDGNVTFDIWSWDGGTLGVAIRSFDGRLFIATHEFSDNASSFDDEGYGVLYQMSGSAMTQLKKWGQAGECTLLGSLMVHDRKMYYGASNLLGLRAGFGVAAYDPVEDAHSIWASNGDTGTYARGAAPYAAYAVDDVIYFNNRIWASVRSHGVFFTPFSFRDRIRLTADYDTTTASFQPGPLNGGWFTTSTYDAGTAGVTKLWRKIAFDYELPHSSNSILVEASTNNGVSWTTVKTVTTGTTITRMRAEVGVNYQSTSIKLRFTLRSTNSTFTPILYGYVVSYIPIIEPNWLWQFTIVLAAKVMLLDGTEETMNTVTEMNFLRDSYRSKVLVPFQDVDGVLFASADLAGALIYDIDFRLAGLTPPLEGDVIVTLLESVETY